MKIYKMIGLTLVGVMLFNTPVMAESKESLCRINTVIPWDRKSSMISFLTTTMRIQYLETVRISMEISICRAAA